MNPRSWTALGLLAVLLSVGCASGRGTVGNSQDHLVMERSEIMEYEVLSAYELIRQQRPAWLSGRRGGSWILNPTGTDVHEIKVYINEQPVPRGIDALRDYFARDIQRMQRLNSADATMRFGTDHVSGAIMVTTIG